MERVSDTVLQNAARYGREGHISTLEWEQIAVECLALRARLEQAELSAAKYEQRWKHDNLAAYNADAALADASKRAEQAEADLAAARALLRECRMAADIVNTPDLARRIKAHLGGAQEACAKCGGRGYIVQHDEQRDRDRVPCDCGAQEPSAEPERCPGCDWLGARWDEDGCCVTCGADIPAAHDKTGGGA